MKKLISFLTIISFLFLIKCSSTTNIKLLPAKEAANIETVWKNKTVGKSSEFTMTISNFIFEDRYLTFLKEGKPIAKVHMEVTPSLPVLFLGWLALGIPYLWIASVKEYQMIDLSTEIKRAATEVNP
jgi:hypothetical protein